MQSIRNRCVRLGLVVLLAFPNACGLPDTDEQGDEQPNEGIETRFSPLPAAGMHGFMITSDKDPSLALNAYGGAVHNGPLKMYRGCPWENSSCTWTYRNGMIISDADPSLALRVSGTAPSEGQALELDRFCTTTSVPNRLCLWLIRDGHFVSEADVDYAIGFADNNPVHGSDPVMRDACTSSNSDACTFTMQSVMFTPKGDPNLKISTWLNGAVDQSLLTLDDGCTRTDETCTFTIRKGLILSDVNPFLAVKASGGIEPNAQLRLFASCVTSPNDSGCKWYLREGVLYPGGLYYGVYPTSGAVAWSRLRLEDDLACDSDPTEPTTRPKSKCNFSLDIGGPQCGKHWQAPCPGTTTCLEGRLIGKTCVPVDKRVIPCNPPNAGSVSATSTIAVTNLGDWLFVGHAHNSGFPIVNFALGFTFDDAINGTKFGQIQTGGLGGTLDFISRSKDWNFGSVDSQIANNWGTFKNSGLTCRLKSSPDVVATGIAGLVDLGLAFLAVAVILFFGGGGRSHCETLNGESLVHCEGE
jgi:hypothetical protein